MRYHRKIGAALLAFACAACGSDGQANTALVRDSAGVTIVDNTTPAWDDASRWQLSAEPVLQIGTAAGDDPAALFQQVIGVTRLGNGNIVVLDGATSEVHWFDASGTHVVTRGGKGGGPGEFSHASELVRLPGDTVLVKNMPLMKFVLFTPEGDLIRDEPLDHAKYRQLGQWIECHIQTLPDRSLLGCQREAGLPVAAVRPGHYRSYERFLIASPALDTAYRVGLHAGIEQWITDVGDGRLWPTVHPFHSWTRVATGGSPLRIAIAVNPAYSIELWTPQGKLDRIVRRTGARRAATEAELEYAVEVLREQQRDPPSFNRILADMEVPDSLPAVTRLNLGPDADLWVTRPVALEGQPREVDIFDRAGAFLGTLICPAGFLIHEVGSDYVIGTRYDDDDVPSIVMYSLARRS